MNDFPMTHNTFRRKWDVKAVSSKVQAPPLLRHRHNAPEGSHNVGCGPRVTLEVLVCPRSNLSLRPLQ